MLAKVRVVFVRLSYCIQDPYKFLFTRSFFQLHHELVHGQPTKLAFSKGAPGTDEGISRQSLLD